MDRLQLRAALPVAILLAFLAGGSLVIGQRLDGGVRLNGVTQGLKLGGTSYFDAFCLDATNQDVCLARDGAANTLAQRNGTAAQASRIYNTFTDASNYERANLSWSGNLFNVTVGAAGTGASRSMNVGTDGTSSGAINLITGGSNRWSVVGASGNLSNGTTGAVLFALAAPTISSGFGTSPSVASQNGSGTFRVNVGTGGAATSGVVTMPTATTGWNCTVQDMTTNIATRQTASTTTTVTFTAASAWTASDILVATCMGY